MKHKFIFLLLFVLGCVSVQVNAISYSLQFKEGDFTLTTLRSDSIMISSKSQTVVYSEPTKPCIPFLCKSFALNGNEKVAGYDVIFSKRVIKEGVDLKNSPEEITTDQKPTPEITKYNGYETKIYPDSNCVLLQCKRMNNFNMVSFLVSPFVFDADENKLYFIDSMQINIETEFDGRRYALSPNRRNEIDALKATVENGDFFDDVVVAQPTDLSDVCEYVIITTEGFKEAFEPLAEWKRKKGVTSRITTVEEIESKYTGKSLPIKIKTYLKELAENNFLRFVLLGGDVEYVPSQPCYFCVEIPGGMIMDGCPADVYYACLQDIDWDTNNDGRVGDNFFDKMDLTPSLYIARAPVWTVKQAEIFVNRIIDYETNPSFVKSMLQAGMKISDILNGDTYADFIISEIVDGSLYLASEKFCDNYTYNGLPFTPQNLANEFGKAYQFVEFVSHGKPTFITDIEGDLKVPKFNVKNAENIKNTGHTLITTMACHTNYFDMEERRYSANPCLSEAFIRNPNSGIIGYLGSSREGWIINSTPTASLSIAYEIEFYKRLLNDDMLPTDKHFGALVDFVKHSFLPLLKSQNKYHWLHYSVNALGDPEMPIFNTYPKSFNSSSAKFDVFGQLNVDTGVENARVCVSSNDGGDYYEVGGGEKLQFSPGIGSYDVWITKQNYKPKHFVVTKFRNPNPPIEIESKTSLESISPNPGSTSVTVTYETTLFGANLNLVFTNISNQHEYSFNITGNDREATLDISHLVNGEYIVTLYENGYKSENSLTFIKI